MSGAIRRPAVAGYFYPAEAPALAALIDGATTPADPERAAAIGLVLPHGGMARTAAVVGPALREVTIPRRCIILGPSHTGTWMPWSLLREGAYRTPLGDVPVDTDLAEALVARCSFLEVDAWAQRGEHAVEVLLPWLQRLGPADLQVVPLIFGAEDPAQLGALAEALAQVVRLVEEPVLLIASTDASHYVPREQAASQDAALFGALARLDDAAFTAVLAERNIVMCGWAAAQIVVGAARRLGARGGRLAAYRTSAEAGGDPHSAIGYGSLIIR